MNGYDRTLNDWLALLPRVVRWRWRWYMGIPKLLVKVITNSRSVVGWWEMLCYTSTWMACKSFRVEIPGDFLLRFVPFTTAARPLYNHQCYIKLGCNCSTQLSSPYIVLGPGFRSLLLHGNEYVYPIFSTFCWECRFITFTYIRWNIMQVWAGSVEWSGMWGGGNKVKWPACCLATRKAFKS